jgi:hypothetical protein
MFTSIAQSVGTFVYPAAREGAKVAAESIVTSLVIGTVLAGATLVGFGAVRTGQYVGRKVEEAYSWATSTPNSVETIEGYAEKPVFASNDSDLYRQGQENLSRLMRFNVGFAR